MAGEKAPYFRFYAFDWDSDFVQRSLDCAGAGIYMRLLTLQWIEGGLVDDQELLRRYVGATEEQWALAWKLLDAKFPVCIDALRRNERLEEERREMEEAFRSQSERGKLGAAAANARHKRGTAAAEAQPKRGTASANHEPVTKNQEPEEKPLARPEPAPHPPIPENPRVYWDNAVKNVEIDRDWLREEIREYGQEIGAFLSETDFDREREALRRELLRDPRLRACIVKVDGKPSSPSKFQALASYTVSWFKKALDMKAGRESRAPPAAARKARSDDAFKTAMAKALTEEAKVGDEGGSDRDSRALAVFLPPGARDRG